MSGNAQFVNRTRVKNLKPPGLLQPLLVVDRFSKYAHLMALTHPYSAITVAKVFMENVYKLHGMPASIVSDRDNVFLS